MSRAKHADLIIAWANGAVLESNDLGEWRELIEPHYIFKPDCEYRIKPKEPEWWENIPKHGVLCWVDDYDPKTKTKAATSLRVIVAYDPTRVSPFIHYKCVDRVASWRYATPLTNEEIERFKR